MTQTETTPIAVTKVVICYVDGKWRGRPENPTFEGADSIEQADKWITRWVRDRIDAGDTSYYKTEVEVHFADGESFRIRPDVYREKRVSVGGHLRRFVEYVANHAENVGGAFTPELAKESLVKYGIQKMY